MSSGFLLSSTTVQTGTAAFTTPISAASSSGLSRGAKTGLGVGIGAGPVTLQGLHALFFLLRRDDVKDGALLLATKQKRCPNRNHQKKYKGLLCMPRWITRLLTARD
ncbi:hypothetical protein ABVK25_008847 [Lepraria finkii]|uniref:Secreted protein n=1 Tax=Lepraria finkii TaxID=1340010 RepID=A0ABR4AZD0_9LECA